MTATRDYEALGARILRPQRAAAREARELLRDATDAREACERAVARGLVAPGWFDPSARGEGGVCPACAGLGLTEAEDQGVRIGYYGCTAGGCNGGEYERALSRELVAALVADVPGAQRAEQLALEAARRFHPRLRWMWSTGPWAAEPGPARRPVWRVADGLTASSGRWQFANALFGPRVWPRPRAADDAAAAVHRAAGRRDPCVELAVMDVAYELVWDAACAEGAAGYARDANPYTPVVDLWAMGYGFDGVGGTTVSLLVPAL